MKKKSSFPYRKEKILLENQHLDHLLMKGFTSFEIADQLIHFMIIGMHEGLKNQFPEAFEEEIQLKMREEVQNFEHLKHLKRSNNNR
jgi:hypothetical protein